MMMMMMMMMMMTTIPHLDCMEHDKKNNAGHFTYYIS
jgi:hypothetical protein